MILNKYLSIKYLNLLRSFLVRFRYPMSLPEDIAMALGIPLSNTLTFEQLMQHLSEHSFSPTRIQKFMSRTEAERAFQTAKKCERFSDRTLFCYCFNQGCIEFVLTFDSHSRLRRVYLHHQGIEHDQGVEIPLSLPAHV